MSRAYNPYLGRYVSYAEPLTIYAFKVTETETGIPVANAQCAIQDVPLGFRSLEGAGGFTDLNGVCNVNVLFAARYYAVYKAGYVTARGSVTGTQINVALTSTAIKYWVTVNAGVGGTVDLFGTYQVAANTKLIITATPETGYALDYWLVNNIKSGSTNPLGVTIDRDNYSIYAIFKEAPSGDGGDGGEQYPVERKLHIIDNITLSANQLETGKSYKSVKFNLGDAAKYVGARVEYRIRYLDGLGGATVGIDVNDQNVKKHENIAVGSDIRNSEDISTRLAATDNWVTVGQSHLPGLFWCIMSYDVYVVLGYSGEPAIEPGQEEEDLLEKYKWWIAGGAGLVGIYLLTRKGQPLIVMSQPYYPREKGEEK